MGKGDVMGEFAAGLRRSWPWMTDAGGRSLSRTGSLEAIASAGCFESLNLERPVCSVIIFTPFNRDHAGESGEAIMQAVGKQSGANRFKTKELAEDSGCGAGAEGAGDGAGLEGELETLLGDLRGNCAGHAHDVVGFPRVEAFKEFLHARRHAEEHVIAFRNIGMAEASGGVEDDALAGIDQHGGMRAVAGIDVLHGVESDGARAVVTERGLGDDIVRRPYLGFTAGRHRKR